MPAATVPTGSHVLPEVSLYSILNPCSFELLRDQFRRNWVELRGVTPKLDGVDGTPDCIVRVKGVVLTRDPAAPVTVRGYVATGIAPKVVIVRVEVQDGFGVQEVGAKENEPCVPDNPLAWRLTDAEVPAVLVTVIVVCVP